MTWDRSKPNTQLSHFYNSRENLGGGTGLAGFPYDDENAALFDYFCITHNSPNQALPYYQKRIDQAKADQYILFQEVRDLDKSGASTNNWTLNSSAAWRAVAALPNAWLHLTATTVATVTAGDTVITVGSTATNRIQTPTANGGILDANGTVVRFTGVAGSTLTGCTKLDGTALGAISAGAAKCRIKSSTGGTLYIPNWGHADFRTWVDGQMDAMYATVFPTDSRYTYGDVYGGIMLDNNDEDEHRIPNYASVFPLAEYATVQDYLDSLDAGTDWIRDTVTSPRNMRLSGNGIGWTASSFTTSQTREATRFTNGIDVMLAEFWCIQYNGSYPASATDFDHHLARAEQAISLDKKMICVIQSDGEFTTDQTSTTWKKARFGWCAYMLVWEPGQLYFRWSNYGNGAGGITRTSGAGYHEYWPFDLAHKRFGNALNTRYLVGNEWRRDFEFGQIKCDPVAQTSSFTYWGVS